MLFARQTSLACLLFLLIPPIPIAISPMMCLVLPHSSSDRPTSSSIHPSCTLPIRFSLLLVHPSSRDTLVRRPQLMHFRPFRHMHSTLPLYLISWCSASSSHYTLNARANPRVCFIGGRRHHPSGSGRPPPHPRNVALPARPKRECALRRFNVASHERATNACGQRANLRTEVRSPQHALRSPEA